MMLELLANFDFTRTNPYTFTALFAGLLNVILGIVAYFNNPRSTLNKSFSVWCFFVAFNCLGFYFVLLSRDVPQAVKWARIASVFLVLLPPAFINFIFNFVIFAHKDRLVKIYYLLSMIFIVLIIATPIFFKEITHCQYPYFNKFVVGPAYAIHNYWFGLTALFGCWLLMGEWKKQEGHRRTQIIYLLLAVAFGGSLSFVGMIIISRGGFAYEFSFLGVIIYATAVSYSIFKHHLMDITFIIRRALVYSILVGIFTGLYLTVLFFLAQVFQNLLGVNSLVVAAIFLFIFAIAFQPLKNRVQEIIDRIFFKSKYEYQNTLKQLSQAAVSVIKLDDLLELIVSKVVDVVKLDGAGVMIFDRKDNNYHLNYKLQSIPPYGIPQNIIK